MPRYSNDETKMLNCPVAHDDACRNWRLLNKMFTCLVDQINDVADRAHAYSKKKGV